MSELAGDMAKDSEQYISNNNTQKLFELAEKAIKPKDITVVHITNEQGSILALAEKNITGPAAQVTAQVGTAPGKVIGKVMITYSLTDLNQHVNSLKITALFLILILLVLSAALVFYLVHSSVASPIKKLISTGLKALPSEAEGKLKLKDKDELSALADILNEMSENLKVFDRQITEYKTIMEQKVDEKTKELKEATEGLQQSSKMAAMGSLSGGIAHDFNNILFAILGNAELVKMELTPGSDRYKIIENIESLAQKGSQLTQKLLSFARRGKIKTAPVSLNKVVREVVDLLERTVEKMIHIEVKLESSLPFIEADASQLYQVILNICLNAKEAMIPKDGGRLYIETGTREFSEAELRGNPDAKAGRYVFCSISDDGIGMDKTQVSRIFEPFYTTKKSGKGIGLGLAVTYGIVKEHKGIITVFSEQGKGSRFDVYLPTSKTVTMPAQSIKTEAEIRKVQGTILVIDDEPEVREMVKRVLERFGYQVLTASDGQKGLEAYEQNKDKISLVILDLIMPGWSGLETLKRLKALYPKVKVLVSTGYSGSEQNQEILNAGSAGFIYKPYSIKQLLGEVSRIIALDIQSVNP